MSDIARTFRLGLRKGRFLKQERSFAGILIRFMSRNRTMQRLDNVRLGSTRKSQIDVDVDIDACQLNATYSADLEETLIFTLIHQVCELISRV